MLVLGPEADDLGVLTQGNMTFDPLESASTDKEDILGIHVNEFLFRMLAATLGRHIHDTAFQQFEQGLLYPFARDITCDGRIVTLAGNLVNFIDEYDAALGLCEVKIGFLEQARKEALHILPHIAGLGEHRSVYDGERDVQHAGDGAGQQGFSGTGRTHQQDIALLQLYPIVRPFDQIVLQALIMVVYGYGQHFFGTVLPNHILVQIRLDFLRLGGFSQLGHRSGGAMLPLQLFYILGGQLGTVRANVTVHPLQQEGDFGVTPATEQAMAPVVLLFSH